MPGWLKSAYDWVIGGIGDLWNKTLGLIGTLYTYITSAVSAIWTGVSDVYHATIAFIDAVEKFAQNAFTSLSTWAVNAIRSVTSYVTSLFDEVTTYVNQLYKWAVGLFDAAYAYIRSLITSVTNWVVRNVYDPIANAIRGIFSWISTYGYVAYFYATHPDALSKRLAHYIWQESLPLLDRYAGIIGSWLIRGMMRTASPVGKVLEDIIASIID